MLTLKKPTQLGWDLQLYTVRWFYNIYLDKPGLIRELYGDIDGTKNGYIEGVYKNDKFPINPDLSEILYNFDSTNIKKEKFAQRVYGWFLPPMTGGYIFYTSCDDACDLFLSANDNPALKMKLVSQKEWSDHNQFDK